MIIALSFFVAFLLRRRYVADDDPWAIKFVYYCVCVAFTPLFGIPFFRLIFCQMKGHPWSRIYNPDGDYA